VPPSLRMVSADGATSAPMVANAPLTTAICATASRFSQIKFRLRTMV
jgi:hypothetical protein